MSLPQLREELDLLTGPALPDGQPSWTLHDPVRNAFFRIDWTTFEIMARWSLDDPQAIIESVNVGTTLKIDLSDFENVATFLADNQLVQVVGGADKLANRLQQIEGTALKWLLHHYLFFRVPLVRPDAWLDSLRPYVRVFFSGGFFLLTAMAFAVGAYLAVRQWDQYGNWLADTYNLEGLVSYGIALFVVKLLHEMGHAISAKHFGCRVPTIGVAFLVMFPMAYTDTNETWRLRNRWQRLKVASAGVVTELIVAIWATLAWGLLPDGSGRDVAFFLATTSWISTLVINTSPFLRFDGYFILCDLLDMPNLHSRSFALACWRIREWLFDLRHPKPEYFSAGKEWGLIVFALVTWIYRLIVFLGIAVLVYQFAVKIIGILLFVIELLWFIFFPVWKEIKTWWELKPVIKRQRHSSYRAAIAAILASAVIVALLVPWPGRTVASGMLRPAQTWTLFAPDSAQLESINVAEYERVNAGAVLVNMSSPAINAKLEGIQARLKKLNWAAASAGFTDEMRQRALVSKQELFTASAEYSLQSDELARYSLVAPFNGQVRDIDPDFQSGQWLAKKSRIGVLVIDGPMVIETYLSEDAIKRIRPGSSGIFVADGLEGPTLDVRVAYVDADASRVLPLQMLSSQAGGHVLVREKGGNLVPEHAVYRVMLEVLTPVGPLARQSWRGRIVLRSDAESLFNRYFASVVAVLVREWGF